MESNHEKNLSTKPTEAGQDPRLSCTDVDAQRAQGVEHTAGERARTPVELIGTPLGDLADARLPRRARLERPRDFRAVFENPEKSVDSCFTVLARLNGGRPARIGLVISKKCGRRAVNRSRLKRVARESFRQRRHDLHGIDLIVLCRHGASVSSNSRLFSSLSVHWKCVRDKLCAIC